MSHLHMVTLALDQPVFSLLLARGPCQVYVSDVQKLRGPVNRNVFQYQRIATGSDLHESAMIVFSLEQDKLK